MVVRLLVKARFDELMQGKPVADPLNVFIKREAHKISKLQEGKYRLISGVSLIDSMIDRILFMWILRACLSSVTKTPCMVGWTPVRGGWRYLKRRFGNQPVTCLDKSAWDWTVVEWMIIAIRKFLHQLPINAPKWWHDMVDLRLHLLYVDPIFQFQDGTTTTQDVVGIQKSGCLLTIILNSVWQSILHYEACFNLGWDPFIDQPICLGDDTLQPWHRSKQELDAYVQTIARLGPKFKDVKIQNWIEFAGFVVLGKTCIPAYWKKHLFNLKYSDQLEQVLAQYSQLYAHSDHMFEYLERLLCEHFGPESVPSREWCKMCMDYDCDPQDSSVRIHCS